MAEEEDMGYQRGLRRRVNEAIKKAQMEQQKKELMKQFLEPDAYERLMNVRLSNPELYNQLVNLIVSLVQSNRIAGKLTEEQLKAILAKITFKREPKIEFKHK